MTARDAGTALESPGEEQRIAFKISRFRQADVGLGSLIKLGVIILALPCRFSVVCPSLGENALCPMNYVSAFHRSSGPSPGF